MAKTYNLIGYEIYERFKLLSISIQTPPTKITYFSGESFDPTGIEVLAQFSDDISGLVTGYTWSPTTLTLDTTTVTISYANGGIVATATISITVENPMVEIPYTNSSFTYNGSTKTPTWINYVPDVMTIGGTTSATNAATYTTTFRLKDGYKWTDGTNDVVSKKWTIKKASGSISASSYNVVLDGSTTSQNIRISTNSGGSISASSSDTSVATVSNTNNLVVINKVGSGSAKIYVTSATMPNYTSATITINVTVEQLFTRTGLYYPAGTYTHTAKGTQAIMIIMGGGGGGGGGAHSSKMSSTNVNICGGGGGGGGGRAEIRLIKNIAITPNQQYNIVVGAGGKFGYTGSAGESGGSSSAFGYTVSGGSGGKAGSLSSSIYSASIGGQGAGGNGGNGGYYSHTNGYDGNQGGKSSDISYANFVQLTSDGSGGGGGGALLYDSSIFGERGLGGAAYYGSGAGGNGGDSRNNNNATTGSNATNAGCGGGGGGGGGGSRVNVVTHVAERGGTGGDGQIIIFENI